MKKRGKITLFIILSFFIITGMTFVIKKYDLNSFKDILENSQNLEKTGVNVDVVNNPKIDIMLTQKDSKLDMTNFESDVIAKLQDYGIDTTNVNIQTVDRAMLSTNTSEASTIFNKWGRIGVAGNWQLTTYNGTSVINNAVNTNGATGFYSNENYNIKDAIIEFDMRTTDADNDITGAFLRFNLTEDNATQTKKKATTYLFIDQMGTDFKMPNGLYKLNNQTIPSTDSDTTNGAGANMYGGPVARSTSGWSNKNTWIHYKFVVEGNNIKIFRKGALILDYTDTSDTPISKGSFGLLNWSQPAMYANFTVSYTVFKEFENVLREPTWRENAHHIVVNVDDLVDETLTGTNTIGEILTRTLNDNIHFIQWGTDTNRSATEDFINKNDEKGIFVTNDDYSNCLEQTVIYIKNLIEQQNKNKYVIIGEDNNLSVQPESLKNDAISLDFPNGRWLIRHNYTYFANDLGQSTSAGVYTKDLSCSFDKPGEYEIYFDDDLVKTVYAHRRPVASFLLGMNDGAITIESNSFDLDSNENIGYGKGIASEKWYYKEINDTNWIEGKITEFDNAKTYVIKLEVTDFQDETSYTTKYIGTGSPVATFNYNADTITKYQNLVVNDTSYDPAGYDITNWTWTLKKDAVLIGTYEEKIPSVLDFNTDNLGVGAYTYSLVVTNSQGQKSEAYSKTFNVIEDTDAPEVVIDPTYCDWKKSQEVSIKFKDADSGFRDFKYAIDDVKETTEDTAWSENIAEDTYSLNITEEGQKYLHIIAYDNAGNLLERTVGTYKIDYTKPNGEYDIEEPTESVRNAVINFRGKDDLSGVKEIILPDGSKTEKTEIAYNVKRSGKYVFKVIDRAGNEETVEVDIIVPTDGVEVIYIDQVTGRDLADREKITGVAGDKYTTSAKEIEGYELVKVPENKDGELEVDGILVKYEYRKLTKVTIKYIDANTKAELIGKKEKIYKEGENYKTLPQDIEGYEISKVPYNQNGVVGTEEIEVVYEYRVVTSGVIVKYVDIYTNEILAESEVIEGVENDSYNTKNKEIDGYELVKIPDNASGKMEFGTIEVIYEYRRVSGGVIVKYIDQVTKENIAEEERIDGLVNDNYTTKAKDVEGYRLVKESSNANGKLGENIEEVVYEYRKISKVTVKYIDEITREEILDKTEIILLEGESYETLPKDKSRYYVLTIEPENKAGVIGKEDLEVIYEYRSISDGLLIKYIDKLTDEVIEEKVYDGGKEGDIIDLEEKTYNGYVLVESPENNQITLTRELQEVRYYYKKEIKLDIKYIDENTGDILDSEEKVGIEGEEYTTLERVFSNYELVKMPENKDGIYSRNSKEVVYGYKKRSGGVIAKYIDKETGNILDEKEILGFVNDIYETEKLQFEKYKLMYIDGNVTGKMSENLTEVNYYYERKTCLVEIVYEDEEGNVVLKEAIKGKVDDKYKVEIREIDGYEIIQVAENAEGIYGLDKIIVKYIVKKIPDSTSPDTSDINIYAYVAMIITSLVIIKKVYKFSKK